jgi:ribosomal protein L37AE/L43A
MFDDDPRPYAYGQWAVGNINMAAADRIYMTDTYDCEKCDTKDSVIELPEGDIYECMDCGARMVERLSIPTEINMDHELMWMGDDGIEYRPGDIIPVRNTREGAYFNEPVIVVHCPGFPGGLIEANGKEIPLPSIDPTEAFFVGPASTAWAWQYRQGQYLMHLSTQKRMGDMFE